jgi:hypothetical protein
LKIYVGYLWDDHPILFFFIPFGIINSFRIVLKGDSEKSANASLLPVLWTVGYPILAMLLAPNARHHNRYMMPLIPFYMLLAASGFYYCLSYVESNLDRVEVVSRLRKYGISKNLISTAALSLIMGVSVYLLAGIWSLRFANDVQNINIQHVAMGGWVKEHIPDESIIALSDIGAITYIAGREKIIDMVGLVNPELLAALESSRGDSDEILLNYLREEKPDYIITHPNCYPQLFQEKGLLEAIHSIELTQNSGISAGKIMAVYKTYWKNSKKAD